MMALLGAACIFPAMQALFRIVRISCIWQAAASADEAYILCTQDAGRDVCPAAKHVQRPSPVEINLRKIAAGAAVCCRHHLVPPPQPFLLDFAIVSKNILPF